MKHGKHSPCRLEVERLDERITPTVSPGPPNAFIGLDMATAALANVNPHPWPPNAPVFALNYGQPGQGDFPASGGLTTASNAGIRPPDGPPFITSPIFFGRSDITPQPNG